jgi:small-conductance mechanosensitive channel
MKKKFLKIVSGALLFLLEASSALAGCEFGELSPDLQNFVTKIKNVLIGLGIAIAAIYIILGGFDFMRAEGDAEKVEKAKQRLLYSLIGVIIIVIASMLVNIVKTLLC